MTRWVPTAVPEASVVNIGGCHVLQALNDVLGRFLNVVSLVYILHVAHWHLDLEAGSKIALACNLCDLHVNFMLGVA
jgi:hypothetical protein